MPLAARFAETAYISLELLLDLEDYRDGRQVEQFGWPGANNRPTERLFPSFRLYARTLDDVSSLRDFLRAENIDTYTRAEEIENIKSLDKAFTIIFSLMGFTALVGFMAGNLSSALAGVKRKSKSFGLLCLLGVPRAALFLFPVIQNLLIGVLGTLLAFLLYSLVAYSIDMLFAGAIPVGQEICSLGLTKLFLAFGVVQIICIISPLPAAWQTQKIEPSEVIREI